MPGGMRGSVAVVAVVGLTLAALYPIVAMPVLNKDQYGAQGDPPLSACLPALAYAPADR